ncbi:MAG: ATP-binding protein [Tenuifilaceae bacterium]|jgi:AAA+ ATPase superfamily predicted ATPase|nr:ATP-binding protein [Tenuifilaceae bacterium]
MHQNPFRYGITVDDPFFVNRKEELKDYANWLQSGQSIVVYSPRRYGKTSLIKKVLKELAAKGHPTIYVDFFKVNSRVRFAELYYNSLFKSMSSWEKTMRSVNQIVKSIRPVFSLDEGGQPNISIQTDGQTKALDLTEVFDLPQKLAKDKRWIVVFDEFQEISNLNGEGFEKELRASLIHHDKVSYVFMGSQMHMLLNIFTSKNRAFYQFSKIVELKKIDEQVMCEHLFISYKETGVDVKDGVIEKIVTETNNIPHYVQYLASAAWEEAKASNSRLDEAVLSTAIAKVIVNQEDFFSFQYQNLTSHQQQLVKAIEEENKGTFAASFINKFRLGSASSIQRSIERLQTKGLIEKDGDEWHFTDPFFKLWLKKL